jgi:copper oxidase (laccase) domain-containing protein
MSYRAPNLPAENHCFFGAKDGVSSGIYASLNTSLKSDDKPENVQRNLEIAAAAWGCIKKTFCC